MSVHLSNYQKYLFK